MYDDCLDGSTVATYCTATNSGKCKTSYFAYQPANSTSVAGGVHRSCSSYEPLEAGFRLKLHSDWLTNRLRALRWNHYKDEDESILDTRAEPIKVTNSYSTGSTSGGSGGGGVSVGGGAGGAISPGGLQSSMASNAGYPMLKCYSCHAQWTLDSNNDCVKIKIRNPRIASSFIESRVRWTDRSVDPWYRQLQQQLIAHPSAANR